MHYGISIDIQDGVSGTLTDLRHYFHSDSARAAIGAGVARAISDHLFAWDATHPNRLGGKRTHIISAAAKATTYKIAGNEVLVSITNPAIAARFFGTTILPVKGKALAIPAVPEAHGKSPREFNFLKLVWRRGENRGALVAIENYMREIQRGKNKGKLVRPGKGVTATHGLGRVLYWLVRRAQIPAEPGILPSTDSMLDAGLSAAQQSMPLKEL